MNVQFIIDNTGIDIVILIIEFSDYEFRTSWGDAYLVRRYAHQIVWIDFSTKSVAHRRVILNIWLADAQGASLAWRYSISEYLKPIRWSMIGETESLESLGEDFKLFFMLILRSQMRKDNFVYWRYNKYSMNS